MASGRNHDRSIYFTSPVVLAIGTYCFDLKLGVIAATSHLLGGLMLSPDLDLVSHPFKRWGFLKFIWLPYQKLIPHHRHWLSHGVIVGSVVRLVYLAAWLSPLWLILAVNQFHWSEVPRANGIAFFCGVELSAINHLVLDGLIVPLPQGIKRRLKGD